MWILKFGFFLKKDWILLSTHRAAVQEYQKQYASAPKRVSWKAFTDLHKGLKIFGSYNQTDLILYCLYVLDKMDKRPHISCVYSPV